MKLDPKKRRATDVINKMFWGNEQQRGFLHQAGDVIEHVFRPTMRRQETLLQQIVTKLERDETNQEINKLNSKTE